MNHSRFKAILTLFCLTWAVLLCTPASAAFTVTGVAQNQTGKNTLPRNVETPVFYFEVETTTSNEETLQKVEIKNLSPQVHFGKGINKIRLYKNDLNSPGDFILLDEEFRDLKEILGDTIATLNLSLGNEKNHQQRCRCRQLLDHLRSLQYGYYWERRLHQYHPFGRHLARIWLSKP